MIRRNRFSAFLALFICLAVLPTVNAGQNDAASFILDFSASDDNKTESTLGSEPVITDGLFTATLVLDNAVSLTGLTVDLRFDPNVLQVVSINETVGDVNFDGRSNIADVLTLAERFEATLDETNGNTEYDYFDLVPSGVIDMDDINTLMARINQTDLYWTSNPNTDGFSDFQTYPESVEIFEDPAVSSAKGLIDDIAVVLLPRSHPPEDGFGFSGDARIATITFQVIGQSGDTTISFEDPIVLDAMTVINDDGSFEENTESRPASPEITITIP